LTLKAAISAWARARSAKWLARLRVSVKASVAAMKCTLGSISTTKRTAAAANAACASAAPICTALSMASSRPRSSGSPAAPT
jgi:hypothetical protein